MVMNNWFRWIGRPTVDRSLLEYAFSNGSWRWGRRPEASDFVPKFHNHWDRQTQSAEIMGTFRLESFENLRINLDYVHEHDCSTVNGWIFVLDALAHIVNIENWRPVDKSVISWACNGSLDCWSSNDAPDPMLFVFLSRFVGNCYVDHRYLFAINQCAIVQGTTHIDAHVDLKNWTLAF